MTDTPSQEAALTTAACAEYTGCGSGESRTKHLPHVCSPLASPLLRHAARNVASLLGLWML
jgi:hypothetical protein